MATIDSIGYNTYSAARQQMVEKAFQGADQDQNGSISKTEFAQVEEQMKARAAQGTSATEGSVSARFAAADTNSDNGLSMEEFAAMLAQAEAQGGSGGRGANGTGSQASSVGREVPSGGVGGPPPVGAAPSAPSVASSQSSSTTSDTSSSSAASSSAVTSTLADPADANGDGVVTGSERFNYDLRHPTADTSPQSGNTGSVNISV